MSKGFRNVVMFGGTILPKSPFTGTHVKFMLAELGLPGCTARTVCHLVASPE